MYRALIRNSLNYELKERKLVAGFKSGLHGTDGRGVEQTDWFRGEVGGYGAIRSSGSDTGIEFLSLRLRRKPESDVHDQRHRILEHVVAQDH